MKNFQKTSHQKFVSREIYDHLREKFAYVLEFEPDGELVGVAEELGLFNFEILKK